MRECDVESDAVRDHDDDRVVDPVGRGVLDDDPVDEGLSRLVNVAVLVRVRVRDFVRVCVRCLVRLCDRDLVRLCE